MNVAVLPLTLTVPFAIAEMLSSVTSTFASAGRLPANVTVMVGVVVSVPGALLRPGAGAIFVIAGKPWAKLAGSSLPSLSWAGKTDPDVAWLDEVQWPPEVLPPNRPKLSPLLVDDDGRKITTLKQWQRRRKTIRRWWLDFLKAIKVDRQQTPNVAERGLPPRPDDERAGRSDDNDSRDDRGDRKHGR